MAQSQILYYHLTNNGISKHWFGSKWWISSFLFVLNFGKNFTLSKRFRDESLFRDRCSKVIEPIWTEHRNLMTIIVGGWWRESEYFITLVARPWKPILFVYSEASNWATRNHSTISMGIYLSVGYEKSLNNFACWTAWDCD